jgi:hypothetical protein
MVIMDYDCELNLPSYSAVPLADPPKSKLARCLKKRPYKHLVSEQNWTHHFDILSLFDEMSINVTNHQMRHMERIKSDFVNTVSISIPESMPQRIGRSNSNVEPRLKTFQVGRSKLKRIDEKCLNGCRKTGISSYCNWMASNWLSLDLACTRLIFHSNPLYWVNREEKRMQN